MLSSSPFERTLACKNAHLMALVDLEFLLNEGYFPFGLGVR